MAVRIGINGFGRIGRLLLRAIVESGRGDLVPIAINDLGSVEANAHLFRYDSVHGRFPARSRLLRAIPSSSEAKVEAMGRSRYRPRRIPPRYHSRVSTWPWSAPAT
jgi:glyceraldehyde-3-phosphate dehydrogenase/erythrose-4-phosphate dehydrogenase